MFVFGKGRPVAINLIQDRKNVTAPCTKLQVTKRKANGDQKIEMVTRREYGIRWNVWDINQALAAKDGKQHPAMFPEALARDHIRSWSNEGDIVLDPFSGSGTTAKMARELGRHYIGIEVNQEYCDIAEKRLAQKLLFGVPESEATDDLQ